MVQAKRKKSSAKRGQKKSSVKEISEAKETQRLPAPNGSGDEKFHEVEEYAILNLDLQGNILSWNRGAEKIKGYAAKEIIGKNYRIFYTTEDRKNHLSEKLLEEAKANGKTSYEGWRVRKDGTRFWGSMTLTAIHDKSGSLTGFLKFTRDLTEKKVAEDMLSNFVEELKQKNEELKKSEERYHKMVWKNTGLE